MPATESLPTGYDSFYLPQEKQDTNEGHSHSHHHHSGTSCAHHHHESAYSHNYWIKNAAQVLPQFLVTFEYDPILEKNSREVRCCCADMIFVSARNHTLLALRNPAVITASLRTPQCTAPPTTPTFARIVMPTCTWQTRSHNATCVRLSGRVLMYSVSVASILARRSSSFVRSAMFRCACTVKWLDIIRLVKRPSTSW